MTSFYHDKKIFVFSLNYECFNFMCCLNDASDPYDL